MLLSMLSQFKNLLKDQKIDFFLLPNSDEFFLEYLPEDKKIIKALTGFSGSNAFVIFGLEKSYFFTDGRYLLQAKSEIDLDEFEIIDLGKVTPLNWLENNIVRNCNISLDPAFFSVSFVKRLQEIITKSQAKLNFATEFRSVFAKELQNITTNLSDEIFCLNSDLLGVTSYEKRKKIADHIAADALLITKPENVCWLLNIRARQVENTPLLLANAILFKDGSVDLFVDEQKVLDVSNDNFKDVNFILAQDFAKRLQYLSSKIESVIIDEKFCNYEIFSLLGENNFAIKSRNNPIELAKSIKSDIEIKNIIKAHEVDGLALTKFLFWLENKVQANENVDELSAAKKLLELRQENTAFLYESFPAISAFASNGSIIHYQPSEKTNKKIDDSNLYLIDSGGQYLSDDFLGTTDVTRTIAFNNPSQDQILNFTRVLKGHIGVARAKFKKGTCGSNLDILARFHLLQDQKDYAHGTGHGVGCFLSVHEGPCGISKSSKQELLPNMLISNEPGYYEDNEYGIRIENLVVVTKIDDEFLSFKTITLAPIDPKLIDFKMLTYPEKQWLKNYHEEVFATMKDKLSGQEIHWLEKIVEIYKSSF